jgi:hypothetical protein
MSLLTLLQAQDGGVVAVPDPASLTLTTFAPAVSVPRVVIPDAIAASLETFAPTVTAAAGVVATPTTADLELAAFAPTVTVAATGVTVTPEPASLTLTTYAPDVTGSVAAPVGGGIGRVPWLPVRQREPRVLWPVRVVPDVAALHIVGHSPIVTVDDEELAMMLLGMAA